jgi:hypothetical protein
MNPHIALRTTLPLLFCSAVVSAQIDTVNPPPVKMGLWQTTVTMQFSGMPNMPGGMPASKPIVTQSCMTPDSWQKGMTTMQEHLQRQKAQCSTAKLQQQGNKFIFDEQCSQSGMSSSVHVEWTVDNQETMHGESNSQMTGGAFAQGMTVHGTLNSKFLSSDCGNVKPGEGKAVQQ